jgi:uncharacterized membrane protein
MTARRTAPLGQPVRRSSRLFFNRFGYRQIFPMFVSHTARANSWTKRLGLRFVFVWFLAGGIAHFARAAWFVAIVPPYIPWPLTVVLVSGAFELLGACGLLVHRTRAAAGTGLAWLTVCVTPANLYMAQHHALFPQFPLWLLVLRLPLQVALLVCIVWSTRTPRWRFR